MPESRTNSLNLSSILVVDDEENTRLGLCLLLQGAGYSVRTAAHGLDALVSLHSFHSDLVLTDFNMPQMNGLEFLKVVRRDFPYVHVIMMSAHDGIKSFLDVHGFAVCDCLAKPVNLESLRKVIALLTIRNSTTPNR